MIYYRLLLIFKDKFGYIERLQDICIPSLKLKLNERKSDGSLTKKQKKEITAFARANIEIRSNCYGGWVVKAPFSTGKPVRTTRPTL